MGRSAKILCAVMAASLLASGCVQSYTPSTDAATREVKIKIGDRIGVVTTRHEWLTFNVTEIRADRFVGITTDFPHYKETRPSSESVEVPFDELAVLQVTRFDAGAAARATALVVVTMTAIGAVIGAVVVPAVPPVVP
jgi:hypothetical protein